MNQGVLNTDGRNTESINSPKNASPNQSQSQNTDSKNGQGQANHQSLGANLGKNIDAQAAENKGFISHDKNQPLARRGTLDESLTKRKFEA